MKKKQKKQIQRDRFNCYVLTKEEAKRIEDDFLKTSPKISNLSVIVSTIVSLIGIIIPLFITREFRVIIMVILVAALITFFRLRNKAILNNMRGIISTTALQKAYHTGICLITEPHGNDINLVSENDAYEYIAFVDLKKCIENDEINDELIKKELSEKMDFDPKYIQTITHIGEKWSTKRARNNHDVVEQTRYEFYHIRFEQGGKKEVNSKINLNKYRWVSLNDLQSRDEVSRQNIDVLSEIKAMLKKEKEGKMLRTGSFPEDMVIKIIWNIASTDQCGQNCSICATNSDRKCMTSDEKSTVLSRIFEYADHVSEIDFSGGDPLLGKDDRDIILRAISVLKDRDVRIHVTTTQKGITQAPRDKNLTKLLRNTEITLDLGNIADTNREAYNKRNKKLFDNTSNLLNDHAENIYVNVPIVNVNTSETDIKKVVETINSLKKKPKRINLLRLMKVGKCDFSIPASSTEREEYRKKLINIIQLFKLHLGNEYDIHLHCALRGLENKDFRCDMREQKIGIDCAGNVFTCAWGGYIDRGEKYDNSNPFYLGNLLVSRLEDIITASRENGKIKPLESRCTCACCVYSYITTGDPDDDSDFLYNEA